MKISYEKTENVKLESLNDFQGDLKELSKVNFNKLWKSMSDNGFSEPFVVWNCIKEKKIYVLGGHQRLKVLSEMKNAGEQIPDEYPCNFVKCNSKNQAKKLLLALTSQYGRITEDGLYQFSIENDIDGDFLKENYEFPYINLNNFINGFLEQDNNEIINNSDPNKEWEGMPEFGQDDIKSFKRLIIHFRNQEDLDIFSKLVKQNITDKTKYIWYPILEKEPYGEVISN